MSFHFPDSDLEISNNPVINFSFRFLFGIIFLITGNSLESFLHFLNTPIPVGVMNFFQILAWSSAFGLFLVGLIKLFKKDKEKD